MKTTSIIVHCSATKAGQEFHASDIDRWHRERGWNGCGYHYVVALDGTIEPGRKEGTIGAHCSAKGQNRCSVGVCYIGGLDAKGLPADTRTDAQRLALRRLLTDLKKRYPLARVYGHRDFEPGKACPCFNAKSEYAIL